MPEEQKLKEVLIIGSDHNYNFAPTLSAAKASGIYEPEQAGIIIGDGNQHLSEEEITSALKGRIDEDTHIYLCGHGDLYEDQHLIGLFTDVPTETSKVLTLLNSLTTKPLHISLDSCYGGAANEDITVLKKGSTLVTHTEPDELGYYTLNTGYFIEYRKKLREFAEKISAAQNFLDNIHKYPITTTFNENKGQYQTPYRYTFRPFTGQRLVMNIETVRDFLNFKQKEFIECYKREVNLFAEFKLPSQITEKEAKEALSDHFALLNLGKRSKYLAEFYIRASSQRIFFYFFWFKYCSYK